MKYSIIPEPHPARRCGTLKRVLYPFITACLLLAVLLVPAGAVEETEKNDTTETAQTIGIGEPVTGSIAYDKDVDYYKFTLSEAGYITWDFEHELVDDKNPFWSAALYDENGTSYVSYNYAGRTLASTSHCVGLTAGTYYLRVSQYSYWNQSDKLYTLTVNFTAAGDWETEHNGEFDSADPIRLNEPVYGSLMHDGDVDCYAFTLTRAGYITWTFQRPNVGNKDNCWTIALYDSVGEFFDQYSYTGDQTTRETQPTGLPAGTYYLKVSAPTSSNHTGVTYTLTVNFTAADDWEQERNDSFDDAGPVETGKTMNGIIMNKDDKDCFKFTLDEPGYITWTFTHGYVNSTERYWSLQLYNGDLESLVQCSYRGKTLTTDTDRIGLPAGTYYMKLTNYGSYFSNETYALTVHFTAAADWETEFNDEFSTADRTGVNEPINGSLMHSSDVDCYRFDLEKADTVRLSFGHEYVDNGAVCWTVTLLDGKYQSIKSVGIYGRNVENFFDPMELEAGTYYVKVTGGTSQFDGAQYTLEAQVKRTVTLFPNGGELPEGNTVQTGFGGRLSEALPVPQRNGYFFGGWYTDKDLANAFDPSETVPCDLTLYARWTDSEPDTGAYRIDSLTVYDADTGDKLSRLPAQDFLARVTVTKRENTDAVVLLAAYDSAGRLTGRLMYVSLDDMTTGSTVSVTLPVQNSGKIASLKAFVVESLVSFAPIGKMVSFPAK